MEVCLFYCRRLFKFRRLWPLRQAVPNITVEEGSSVGGCGLGTAGGRVQQAREFQEDALPLDGCRLVSSGLWNGRRRAAAASDHAFSLDRRLCLCPLLPAPARLVDESSDLRSPDL